MELAFRNRGCTRHGSFGGVNTNKNNLNSPNSLNSQGEHNHYMQLLVVFLPRQLKNTAFIYVALTGDLVLSRGARKLTGDIVSLFGPSFQL